MEAIKIHPFDMYILYRDNPAHNPIERGREVEFMGKLYHQTTSVAPVTTEIT